MNDLWKITFDHYNAEEEKRREALCALGNGYIVTRGAAEEYAAGKYHYPGTYLAGGYNRLETEISGKIIENEDLVNWPNWLLLTFSIEGSNQWFIPENLDIKHYHLELDVQQGLLTRTITVEDQEKRRTTLTSRRIVSMANPHLAAIEWQLKAENWSGNIIIHSAIDGTVCNAGVERYKKLSSQHLHIINQGAFENNIFLVAQTNQSGISMAQAARVHIAFDEPGPAVQVNLVKKEGYIAQEFQVLLQENKPLVVQKTVAIYTSRDKAVADPLYEAQMAVKRAATFEALLQAHVHSWQYIWHRCDTLLEDEDSKHQLLLRLHSFHVFQTCSLHTIEGDAGVPARGWHGEAYRGHIFWDELFIFPLLNNNLPELTRALLMYRYRRLEEARFAAKAAGYKGAMFPWQSGSNGREESQVIHLNPQSGRWLPDNTYLQRHINAAIAYNVWQYYEVTGDVEFLSFYGAEMLLSIAQFWASIASFNQTKQRYEICGVVGPDEYHTERLGSDKPGLDNNAYTNIMAVWTLLHALEIKNILGPYRLQELMTKLEIDPGEFHRWETISKNMFVPFIQNGRIIEQFEGFDQLEELDWEKYHEQYGEMLRLDRILEKEGDRVDRYKAVKQADVLMLFYLFSGDELIELLQHIGYNFRHKYIPANISYYRKVTSHGSTLSKLVYSWVYARSRRDQSWEDFKQALVSDFEDIQGGTTAEGIHLGAMAGTVDLIQRCYTGYEFRGGILRFNARLPRQIKKIAFRLHYRKEYIDVTLTQQHLKLRVFGGWNEGVTIIVNNRKFRMKKGQEKTFLLKPKKKKST